MPNNRIFYATQAVALKSQGANGEGIGTQSWYYPRGLQSVGMTTNFGLTQVFQLGQIELYDNVEDVPEIQVTMTKNIDGTIPLYIMCMNGNNTLGGDAQSTPVGANGAELVALANNRVNFRLGIFSDTLSAASGAADVYIDCSGMYLSSVSYNIPVDGVATEDVTLVGNNKLWNSGTYFGGAMTSGAFSSSSDAGKMTAPNLARRYRFNKANSVLPTGTSIGDKSGGNIATDAAGNVRLQSVKVSTDLGREAIYELGAMAPYFRYVKFPVEVTSEFEIVASSGDYVEANDFSSIAAANSCTAAYRNLSDKRIFLTICGTGSNDKMSIDLGAKNKLTSVNYAGGDTGGGNATVTYSYQTFNKLVVSASGSFADKAYVDNANDTAIAGD